MRNDAAQAWRFASGLHAAIRATVPHHLPELIDQLADDRGRRVSRLLSTLDTLVWSRPTSPYLQLLDHAGVARHDFRHLVEQAGIEGALAAVRDEGVFVSYDEWSGRVPAVRGSATFHFEPGQFLNHAIRPDFLAATSGTRSGGIPVTGSFAHLRRTSFLVAVPGHHHSFLGAPTALWFPVLPAAAGVSMLVRFLAVGQPVERWFSQVEPGLDTIQWRKRMATTFLPLVARTAGRRAPVAEHVPAHEPGKVLEWCATALGRSGRALLGALPSSAARLAAEATAVGQSLTGLTVLTVGEPMTPARAAAIRAAGAAVVDTYGFMQLGVAGQTCAHRPDEVLHLFDQDVAVVTRPVRRPDGEEVAALLFTGIAPDSRCVLLNLENDDYGEVAVDDDPCSCAYGAAGLTGRLSRVRGVSKVVAGGARLRGEDVERLVEHVLPGRFGGGPGHYQLAEVDEGPGVAVVLRIDPAVGPVDADAVVSALRGELRRSDPERLTDEAWGRGHGIRVVREAPVPARSGKLLPFEPLRPQ